MNIHSYLNIIGLPGSSQCTSVLVKVVERIMSKAVLDTNAEFHLLCWTRGLCTVFSCDGSCLENFSFLKWSRQSFLLFLLKTSLRISYSPLWFDVALNLSFIGAFEENAGGLG